VCHSGGKRRKKPLPRKDRLDKLIEGILDGRRVAITFHEVDVSYIMDKMKINFSGCECDIFVTPIRAS
jgi:hypothetical protein